MPFSRLSVALLLCSLCSTGALASQRGLPALDVPAIKIAGSSRAMPAVGFGTCCRDTASGPPLVASTKTFLGLGGRLIDTARIYGNHQDVAKAIAESGVPREEIWITSKVWITPEVSGDDVLQAVKDSLPELGVDYIDLMLLHWPNSNGTLRAEQWRSLIDAKEAGYVHNIGVSNYSPKMIEGLINATGVSPSVNQISYNPGVASWMKPGVKWFQDRGIAVTAYGSLRDQMSRSVVREISSAHGASSAQVLLQWALDQGVAVIPGATSEEHIRDCLGVGSIHLTSSEATLLEAQEQ